MQLADQRSIKYSSRKKIKNKKKIKRIDGKNLWLVREKETGGGERERKRERWTWKHALLVRGGAVVWGGGSIGFGEKAEPRACAVLWSHLAERNWQKSEGEKRKEKNNNRRTVSHQHLNSRVRIQDGGLCLFPLVACGIPLVGCVSQVFVAGRNGIDYSCECGVWRLVHFRLSVASCRAWRL